MSTNEGNALANGLLYPELKGLLPPEEAAAKMSPMCVSGSGRELRDDAPVFQSTSRRGPVRQIIAACMASLSAVSFGFIAGYSSMVLPQLSNDTSIHYDEASHAQWIASLPAITSIAGSLVGGVVMDKLGPRMTLLVMSLPCVLSWGFVAFANSVPMLLVGRALTGVFLGVYSPVPQVSAPCVGLTNLRGLLGAFPEVAAALGSMLCYVFGNMMGWRLLAVTSALVPGLPLFFAMLAVPESPQWLTKRGRLNRAHKSVAFFRGRGYDAQAEVAMIRENIVAKDGAEISIIEQFKLFRLPQNWKPILVVFLVFMCGQFSGFAVVVNYTVTIFNAANTGIDSYTSTIIVGTVRFVSTLVSAALLDRVGRRPLLMVSAVGSSVGMLAIGVFFYVKEVHDAAQNIGWLPLASLLLYVFFNELGYGPIPWLLSGELIPLAVRTLGNGVAVTAYSLFAFIISLTFPMLLRHFSSYAAFWMYAAFSLSGVIISWWLPETKGRTLEQIEDYFMPKQHRGKPARNVL
ncbi:facilitated trehalose transporter Tret1 [Hyalella azteca]|uniref:Facilitated trehalose transporter Tret1 n=1 Tax=Hyalella azteca TaxID=294128 RepID=A0A979FS57_HYAAZ|nr:facilitated trehalose transporter Tret1 [Hyalella azteca]